MNKILRIKNQGVVVYFNGTQVARAVVTQICRAALEGFARAEQSYIMAVAATEAQGQWYQNLPKSLNLQNIGPAAPIHAELI